MWAVIDLFIVRLILLQILLAILIVVSTWLADVDDKEIMVVSSANIVQIWFSGSNAGKELIYYEEETSKV